MRATILHYKRHEENCDLSTASEIFLIFTTHYIDVYAIVMQ